MTSNRVHDAARYGAHHINIADNSLDNREFCTSSPFSYNRSKTSHAHLKVFLICSKHFGVNYVTLKHFNYYHRIREKLIYHCICDFQLAFGSTERTKHHTQTRPVPAPCRTLLAQWRGNPVKSHLCKASE